jgi:hypothetical protein
MKHCTVELGMTANTKAGDLRDVGLSYGILKELMSSSHDGYNDASVMLVIGFPQSSIRTRCSTKTGQRLPVPSKPARWCLLTIVQLVRDISA